MRRHTVYALAEKLNLTRIGNERTAHEIEKGCLPGAVGSHDPEDLTRLHSQTDAPNSNNPAEAL
jgi:hypothetical protein